MATEKRRYIRKNGSPHILPFTDALASRDDTYECDEKGNKVAQADPPVQHGIQPPVHLRDHAEAGKPTTESTFRKPEPVEPITTLQSAGAAAVSEAKATSKKADKAKADAK